MSLRENIWGIIKLSQLPLVTYYNIFCWEGAFRCYALDPKYLKLFMGLKFIFESTSTNITIQFLSMECQQIKTGEIKRTAELEQNEIASLLDKRLSTKNRLGSLSFNNGINSACNYQTIKVNLWLTR